MESGVTQQRKPNISESQDDVNMDSGEKFKKFVYELFEKNGIIHDLRAYLRGHIINVLRSAQTGDPPACHKKFIQRLELNFQALNILIAEYLICLKFSYSLSVFVSEIPLANMMFAFAKSLMKTRDEDKLDMRFTDSDVWSILNYLGVPCDSEYASRVVKMYNDDKSSPLLLCMLKCQCMYDRATAGLTNVISSEETLSGLNSDCSYNNGGSQHTIQPKPEKCKHLNYCRTCQNHILNIKGKYKRKKKELYKMFQQLKSVFETEVEMMKAEEENKVKRSLASHALQLQKQRDEMEQSFKAREAELSRSVADKKRFLWGLAQALRDQHRSLARAMRGVRGEAGRLADKEASLKAQMVEGDQFLQKRGEEMCSQITKELAILEAHLNSMRNERETINKERLELEKLKYIESTANKIHTVNTEELNSHYELLRTELGILKKYLESSKLSPKCVIERGTDTGPYNVNSKLNNSVSQTAIDDKLRNQLVNDFKKKNVNFDTSNLDAVYQSSSSSGSSQAEGVAGTLNITQENNEPDIVKKLKQENIQLKECSRQQQLQIEALTRAASLLPCAAGPGAPGARSAAPGTEPPPAASAAAATPTDFQPFYFLRNMNTNVSGNTASVGWRKGAGEELSLFRNAQPRVYLPGDSVPFVGVLRDRDRLATSRRQLVNQWRALRSRTYPPGGVNKRAISPFKERQGSSSPTVIVSNPKASCSFEPDDVRPTHSVREKTQHRKTTVDAKSCRDRSPKSVLMEAKARLRNVKETETTSNRQKSPTSVLREAKLRLRKLEIEAEAMEQSYRDFRRRQSELRLERKPTTLQYETATIQDAYLPNFDIKRSQSLEKLAKSRSKMDVPLTDYQKSIRSDFDKYLREYQNKIEFRQTFSKNETSDIVHPIHSTYSEAKSINTKVHRDNYLETPLTEFKKLYQSNIKIGAASQDKLPVKNVTSNTSELSECGTVECDDTQPQSPNNDSSRTKHSKASELNILKENMNKIYNLNEEPEFDAQSVIKSDIKENLLRIEVESMNGVEQAQNISVVVQSAVISTRSLSQGNYSPDHMSGHMTVIVTPNGSTPKSREADVIASPERVTRSSSPEQEANLTRNDVFDAIFNADTNNKSSTFVGLEMSKDLLESMSDNLSGDIDNSDSHIDLPNSPISVVNTSDKDNFWD